MNLALFDFDGTLTTKDSFIEFIKFYKGKFRFAVGFILLLPFIVMFKLKILQNWRLKEMVLQYFFKNTLVTEFDKKCHQFANSILPDILRQEAINKLSQHQQNNDRVIIITASAENWIHPWASKNNIELIGTRLEKSNNRITGKISGYNCYGREKVFRLKETTDISKYTDISVYGDSSGDMELMNLATKRYFKIF